MVWRYLSWATAAIVSYQVLRLTRKYVRWFTSPLQTLPGPKRSFLLGAFAEILRRPFFEAHFEWWEKAGKEGTDFIHYTQLFGSSSVLVLNADHVKKILLANYRQPQYVKKFASFERLLGKGLVTLEGEDWHRHRRIIQPSFQVAFLKSNLDQHVPQRVLKFLECWKKAGPERAIDAHAHFSMLTLDILGEIAFAHDFQGIQTIQQWAEGAAAATGDEELRSEDLPQVSDRLIQAMTASMKGAPKRILLSLFGLGFLDREAIRMQRALDDAVAEVIQNARERFEERGQQSSLSTNGGTTKYGAKSVLEALLDAKDSEAEGGKGTLQDSELQSEVKTFILAGHETTSTWCYWATYCLCRYPEIQERVYQDIVKHAPRTSTSTTESRDGVIDLEIVEKMTYLDAFMKEVLRLHTPVGMILRHSTEDEDYGGTLIPKDTRLVLPVYLLHRSPRYWKDPELFQPERWLRDEPPYSNLYAYLPFSHGPRNCIGYRFATMEAKLIMASILQQVRFEFIPELRNTDFKLTSYITVKAKPTVKVNAKFRDCP